MIFSFPFLRVWDFVHVCSRGWLLSTLIIVNAVRATSLYHYLWSNVQNVASRSKCFVEHCYDQNCRWPYHRIKRFESYSLGGNRQLFHILFQYDRVCQLFSPYFWEDYILLRRTSVHKYNISSKHIVKHICWLNFNNKTTMYMKEDRNPKTTCTDSSYCSMVNVTE